MDASPAETLSTLMPSNAFCSRYERFSGTGGAVMLTSGSVPGQYSFPG